MKTMSIKAIFFDFGGTLVSMVPSKEELFIKAARLAGLKLNKEEVKKAYHIVDFHIKYSSIKIKNAEARSCFYHDYNKHLCEALGISDYFVKLNPILIQNFGGQREWKLIKDVKFVLKNLLKRDILLSIVANWDQQLSFRVERLGIKKYFSSILASQEVGFEKPDTKIFKYALNGHSLSAKKDCVLYVGNEYETDVVGARMAGLVPVLIDSNKCYPYADCLRFDSIIHWYRSLVILGDEIRIKI